MATKHPLDAVLELAELLRPAWAEISAGIPDWHPRCEDPPADDPPADDPPSDDPPTDDPPADDPPKDTDWKAMARKHEREAKKARKERDDLAAKQKDRDDAAKTEHEKALDKAREDGKAEAITASQKERRADRLEVATTRLAAKGVKVGQGDDAKTIKFADPEDAMVNIERAIDRGDLDADDIFDNEGKVQTDALTTALADLLERKPHLKAADNGGRAGGSADGGKGDPGKTGDDMSVDDHVKAISKHK